MIVAVCVLQAALVIFMNVEMFPAMVVARYLQGAASSVVFSGMLFPSSSSSETDQSSRIRSHVSYLIRMQMGFS
jgi:hypothetical protein